MGNNRNSNNKDNYTTKQIKFNLQKKNEENEKDKQVIVSNDYNTFKYKLLINHHNDNKDYIDDDFKVMEDNNDNIEENKFAKELLSDEGVQNIINSVGGKLLYLNDEKAFEDFVSNISSNKIVIAFIKTMQEYVKEEIGKALKKDIPALSNIYIHDIDFSNYEINTVLDEIIDEKRLNQTEIADKMGINRTTLYNLTRSPNSVSLLNAFKISKLLGLNIEDIFFYREK